MQFTKEDLESIIKLACSNRLFKKYIKRASPGENEEEDFFNKEGFFNRVVKEKLEQAVENIQSKSINYKEMQELIVTVAEQIDTAGKRFEITNDDNSVDIYKNIKLGKTIEYYLNQALLEKVGEDLGIPAKIIVRDRSGETEVNNPKLLEILEQSLKTDVKVEDDETMARRLQAEEDKAALDARKEQIKRDAQMALAVHGLELVRKANENMPKTTEAAQHPKPSR